MLRLANLLVVLLVLVEAGGEGVGEAREKAEINKEEGTSNIQDKNQVTEHVSSGDIDKKDLREQNSEESLTSESSTSASSGSIE